MKLLAFAAALLCASAAGAQGVLSSGPLPASPPARLPAATSGNAAESAPLELAFPGGVTLEIKSDEMSDRKVCTAFTPMSAGVYVGFGRPSAMIWTSEYWPVDYDAPALLRIGEAAPFNLIVPGRPNALMIPSARLRDFAVALYTRSRLRLRFTRYPEGDVYNGEIEPGDFAAAYDRGVELCGWPRLGVAGAHLSKDPVVASELGGGTQIFFGGRFGWMIREIGEASSSPSCFLSYGADGVTVASFSGGRESDAPAAIVEHVLDRDGHPVASSGSSLADISAAAARAGDSGMLEIGAARASLFGFQEAVRTLRRDCSLAPQNSQMSDVRRMSAGF